MAIGFYCVTLYSQFVMTDKKRLFVQFYLQCFNATEAARLAGYAHPNVAGPRLRWEPEVGKEIERGIAEAAMGRAEILARLGQIARGSLLDFVEVTEDGKTKISLDAGRNAGLLGIVRRYSTNGIELYSALDALELIGRGLGLWKGDFVNKPSMPLPISELVEMLQSMRKDAGISGESAGTSTNGEHAGTNGERADMGFIE